MAGSTAILAIGRTEVAEYVSTLFIVYIALVFVRIVLSWVPRLPENPVVRTVADFVHETTDPYLRLFRRLIPPIGAGGMGLDLTPMIGIIVLYIARSVIVGAISP